MNKETDLDLIFKEMEDLERELEILKIENQELHDRLKFPEKFAGDTTDLITRDNIYHHRNICIEEYGKIMFSEDKPEHKIKEAKQLLEISNAMATVLEYFGLKSD